MTRRIAAHRVVDGTKVIDMGAVEMNDGIVARYYSIDGELPMTVWMGGTIYIKSDEKGLLRAYKNGKQII